MLIHAGFEIHDVVSGKTKDDGKCEFILNTNLVTL
jgi:hypothetical protein